MKRLLCWAASMYIMGILLAIFLEIEIMVWISFGLLLVFMLKYVIGRGKSSYHAALILLCILVGYWRFSVAEDIFLMPIAQFVDKPVSFTGWVTEPPLVEEDRIQYSVQVKKIHYQGKEYLLDTRIRLICGRGAYGGYDFEDILQVRGELSYPSSSFNQGGFDYRNYLKGKGIYAICFASPYQINKVGQYTQTNFIIHLSTNIRISAIKTIDRYLPKEEAALLKGMLIGAKESFSDKRREEFSRSGLAHLTAVSGIHVAIFIIGITYLLSVCRVNKHIIHLVSIILIILFVFATGCSPSVLRAGTMGILFFVSYLINKEADSLTSLSIAALAILIYNPVILLDVGFQLSFGATVSLLLFYKPVYEKLSTFPRMIRETATASITAQLGTVIITAYHFNSISIISIIGNLIVVPVASLVLLSGFTLCALGNLNVIIGKVIAGLCYLLLKLILAVVHLISQLPFASVKVPSPSILIIFAYLLLLIILYNLLKEHKKSAYIKIAVGILILLIGINILVHVYAKRYMEVTFLNVGQGDCILIKCPNGRNVMIDGGGSGGADNYDIGKNIVIPYLLKRGIMKIDMVIISHYHDDHVEGALSVLKEMPVGALLLPQRKSSNELMQQLMNAAMQQHIPVYAVAKGMQVNMGRELTMEILYPDVSQLNNNLKNENDQSLVLNLHHQDVRFLFTGDIEKGTEKYLVSQEADVKANVIKVPHHGSDTSLTEDFLLMSASEYAVISVGRNHFGHPSEEVLRRLDESNIEVYRTDINGTITFISDGISIKNVNLYREGE
ncbi:MAG: DNA internalization-related competence protein ComEC/Rec2 [Clostridia bacterium]